MRKLRCESLNFNRRTKSQAEAMIHWNGPLLHEADKFIIAFFDHYFTDEEGEPRPWNFRSTDDRGRQIWTVSEVIDRLKREKSKFAFMTN